MYTPIKTQSTCATCWLEAVHSLLDGEKFNVILDIDDPVNHTPEDHIAISKVDQFLKKYDKYPISTVANTIFPRSIYRRLGRPGLYQEYLKAFESLTKEKRWGRYFERMIRWEMDSGNILNPLEKIIEKLRHSVTSGPRYKSSYELTLYNPAKDSNLYRGGQCLSFISVKLDSDSKLMLTAMYRNHMYMERCLGNLIGLGWLMDFIAKEVGIEVGSLTVISTHAEIGDGKWGKRGVLQLLDSIKKSS
tara:strand:+ start:86 stop:826 length:741 start_codon:yes stop_codon:yes gene_type:complete